MKSLEKVFKIFDLLKENKAMKLMEINNQLGLTKSTTHRILSELVKNKYIHKDSNNNYRLGYKFLEMSSYIFNDYDIRDFAKKSIDKLNELTKETIHLAVLLDDEVVYVEKRESQHTIRMYSQLGKSAPIYCTGVGKALLAFQPQYVIERILNKITLKKYTDNTITDKDLLLKELSKIRSYGYALDVEEHEKNIGCIAAPIWNSRNCAVASLSITAILYRMEFEQILKYKDLLIEECNKISESMGYSSNGQIKNN